MWDRLPSRRPRWYCHLVHESHRLLRGHRWHLTSPQHAGAADTLCARPTLWVAPWALPPALWVASGPSTKLTKARGRREGRTPRLEGGPRDLTPWASWDRAGLSPGFSDPTTSSPRPSPGLPPLGTPALRVRGGRGWAAGRWGWEWEGPGRDREGSHRPVLGGPPDAETLCLAIISVALVGASGLRADLRQQPQSRKPHTSPAQDALSGTRRGSPGQMPSLP